MPRRVLDNILYDEEESKKLFEDTMPKLLESVKKEMNTLQFDGTNRFFDMLLKVTLARSGR